MSTCLRNGRVADPRRVAVVKGVLARFFGGSRRTEGMGAVEWLVRYARHRTPETLQAIPPRYMDLLRHEGLVNPLADIDAAILDIVDACIEGEGLDMVLVPPEDTGPSIPWSQQAFRVVDAKGEAVRVSVDKLAGWLGFSPERREAFLSTPALAPEERRAVAAELAASLFVDPSIIEVAEHLVLQGVDPARFLSVVVELGVGRGKPMRLVVGSAREAA